MSAQKYALIDSGNTAFPRGTLTRWLCIAGLCASYSFAIVCVAVGGAYFKSAQNESQGWVSLDIARGLKETIPLLVNVLVAVLTECSGYIHATTLRWALGNNLNFTSNLRLFSRVKGCLPFGIISNFFNAGFLILSYSATSLILVGVPHAQICDVAQSDLQLNGPHCDKADAVYFCPGALIALGIGLAGTAALTTWQLFTIEIPTWSSSPIDIVWASFSIGQRRKVGGRCMVSVHESASDTAPRKPEDQQQSAWLAHRDVRNVLIYLWVIVIAVFIWFAGLAGGISHAAGICATNVVYVCTVYAGSSWSLLPDTGGITSLAQIDTVFNQAGGGGPGSSVITNNSGFAVAFLLILAFQSFLTMGLHCTELLVNLSRDEDVWRETSTHTGYFSRNAFSNVARSWKSLLLFALKPIVHWLFGLGMTFYYGWGIFMRPPQLLYLSIAMIIVAVLGTYVCFTKPKGPQPAAFGHVQTLVNLIDEWDEHLFWGHKGRGTDGICHAGTANVELENVVMTEEYAAG